MYSGNKGFWQAPQLGFRKRVSVFSTPFERFPHRDLVGVVDLRAHGNAHGDSGHAPSERLDELREVDGGCFPLHVGVRRENDLFHLAASQPIEKALDLELVGTDPLERGEASHYDLISSL